MPSFVCPFCPYAADDLQLHLKHSLLHTVKHAEKYHCGYYGCKYNFNTEGTLRSHLLRTHKFQVSVERHVTLQNVVQDDEGKLKCSVSLCGEEFGKYGDLSKHLAEHINSGSVVPCPVQGCCKEYKVVSSLRGHISKCHRTEVKFEEPVGSDVCSSDVVMVDAMSPPSDPAYSDLRSIFLSNLSYLFLQMETKLMIPQSSIQEIASQIFTLQNIHAQHTQEVLGSFLASRTDPHLLKKSLEILKNNDLFEDCREDLRSSHMRHVFYKKSLNYIPPVKVTFGKDKEKFFHYVSIRDSIKSVIKSTSDLISTQSTDPLVLQDIFDGKNIKDDPFLSQKDCLSLIFFQDAFEVASRAKKKHKLLGIYFTIGNLPIHLRSHLDYIFLVVLIKEKDYNSDRDAVHQKVVNELMEIEKDGICLESQEVVKGAVCSICGDNLGAHGLMNMLENFSTSMYFCRFCVISRQEFVADAGEVKFYGRRTMESYNQSVAIVQADDKIMSDKGVKGDSVYNQLRHFHVCKPGLPPCLAHDLFEGIVKVDVALYLRYFVEVKHWFSYKTLNKLIMEFPYSTEDQRDKPEYVKEKPKHLVGKACQIETFLRLLPLILFGKIQDMEDKVWNNVLRLQEINDIICSPVIHVSVLPYLDLLIRDYIQCRMASFPRCPLRPKHHFMAHYSELIRIFGPLILLWSLRFESKHGYFINALTAGKNFKNVTLSASEKHQLYQAYMIASRKDTSFITMKDEMEFHSIMYSEELRELFRAGVASEGLFDFMSVTFKGTYFSKGDLVGYEQKENEYSLRLGTIRVIISDGCEKLYFIVQCVDSCYDSGLRAYVLGNYGGFRCVNVNEFVHRQPVRQYKVGTKIYAKLKVAIVCNPIV